MSENVQQADEQALSALAEQVVLDRLAFYGFTPEQIEDAQTQTHQSAGCEFDGDRWVCETEHGTPLHAWKDGLDETGEFVMWVLEHPAVARLFRPEERPGGGA